MIALVFTLATRAFATLSIRGQRRLGRWLGRGAWAMGGEAVQVTRANLAACLPALREEERERLGRRSLEHTAALLTESGVVFHWGTPRWQPLVKELDGDDLIDAARNARRPVLILAPHFGNWEFLALILGRYGVTALYDPPKIRALEPLIRRARNRAGATLLPIDPAGIRRFYQALKSGGVVAMLPDQVPERDAGVYADFFGVPALTMTFVHKLVKKADPLVLLGSAMRCEGGFRVRFTPVTDDIAHPDPVESATAMNRAIEALVAEDPAQYQWEYKRFKRPPPGQPRRYGSRS